MDEQLDPGHHWELLGMTEQRGCVEIDVYASRCSSPVHR